MINLFSSALLLPTSLQIFPMDYIAVTLLVFYYVLCTAAGVVHAGVRFCFMKVQREGNKRKKKEDEGKIIKK